MACKGIYFCVVILGALYILYLKTTMDCCYAKRKIFPSFSDSRKASVANDIGKCRLGGKLANALNEVLVRVSVIRNHLTQRRYNIKRVKVVYPEIKTNIKV